MNREEQIQRLKDIQGLNLPVVTYEDVKHLIGEVSEEDKIIINEYFSKFVKYEKCLWCDKTPYLQWGLAHGVAHCDCGFEFVAYHYIKIDGNERKINITLQYHPSCFSIDEDDVD